jgi:hypothetical protein
VTVVFVLSVALAGCGSDGVDLVDVRGKVTYKDQPVEGATVSFFPEKGPLATGQTNADGEYTLSTGGKAGAVLGDHKVSITKFSGAMANAPEQSDQPPDGPIDPSKDPLATAMQDAAGGELKSEVPQKYAAPETSGLKATVTSDESKNVFDFPLTD